MKNVKKNLRWNKRAGSCCIYARSILHFCISRGSFWPSVPPSGATPTPTFYSSIIYPENGGGNVSVCERMAARHMTHSRERRRRGRVQFHRVIFIPSSEHENNPLVTRPPTTFNPFPRVLPSPVREQLPNLRMQCYTWWKLWFLLV